MGFDQRSFGQRLRLARRRAGLTQEELARRAGLTVGAYRRVERGRVHPYAGTVVALARALEVSTDWLLGRESEEQCET
ncbi:helix-turn-helix domain-containing protein [Thermomicrobium sp.]